MPSQLIGQKESYVRQGPLITDGRNSSKWTGHYVGWSKTLKIVKISEQIF